ncbi:hypothetical protein J2S37_001429 [Corynebacterium felinum]|uniref:Uncharacterized protein n=1 Tax=Corynebacterium felinum TaxID=131318 RepID=A0ABU2B932_9CORY|nr:hypothetical protein [Corynebacterium felinum]
MRPLRIDGGEIATTHACDRRGVNVTPAALSPRLLLLGLR